MRRGLPALVASTMLGCSLLVDTSDLSSPRSRGGDDAQAPLADAAPDDGGDGGGTSDTPQSAYRTTILADNPLGYWRMGQPNASRIPDETGRGNDLVLSGATTVVPGAIAGDPDTAIAFDGDESFATAIDGAPFTFAGQQAFSVEVWMKRRATAVNEYEQICGSSDGLGSSRIGWLLFIDRGPPTVLSFQWRTPGNLFTVERPAPAADAFAHVVATYDGRTAATWVDGVESSRTTTSGALPDRPPRLSIGGDPQESAGSDFSGAVDEVAVYDRALRRDEILRHLAVGRGM